MESLHCVSLCTPQLLAARFFCSVKTNIDNCLSNKNDEDLFFYKKCEWGRKSPKTKAALRDLISLRNTSTSGCIVDTIVVVHCSSVELRENTRIKSICASAVAFHVPPIFFFALWNASLHTAHGGGTVLRKTQSHGIT